MKKLVSIRCLPLQIFVLAFIFSFVVTSLAYSSESKQAKKILIIHSDVPEMSYVKLMHKGIFDFFASDKGTDVEYFIEYMEEGRYRTHEYETKLREMYSLKYSINRPDLIITVSYQALKFITAYGKELFPGVPVVFTSIIDHELDELAIDNDLITGIYTVMGFGKLFETMQRLQPDLERIVVITGSSPYDIFWRKKIAEAFSAYNGDVEFEYLHDLSMDKMKERISQYRKGTAVYYFMMLEDGAGNKYQPWKALTLLASSSGVPVFSSFDSYMGHGTVGGYQLSFEFFGKLTAETAQRVIEGEAPSNIPIIKHTDWPYIFDWRELKRWNIDESDLPEGSIVRYKEWSFWDLYRWYIIGGIFFMLLVGFIIFSLVVQRKKGKQIEKRLRDAEMKYRTVADFTYDWEYWESPEGKMLYVSPSCERISGYNSQELMANPDLMQEIILMEDRDIWADHRHKARTKSGPLEIEFRIKRPDGKIRYIEHACQPVHDAEGTFLGFRASNRDITKRKLVENELKRRDKMLEDAQRIARLGSWDWDIITNKLEWSDEVFRIFGLSPQTFGATYDAFLESVHPDDLEEVKEAGNRALSDPSFSYNITHRIRRPDGSEGVVRERAKVTFDDNTGKASRMIGTVQDITDIKRVESEAERLRGELSHMDRVRIMGVLTASIAHEINQPLAAILSNAQAALRFLKRDPQDLEEVKEALRDIVSDDKHAGEIVRSIRKIMGRPELKREKMDLNKIIGEVLTLIKSEALLRTVSLTVNLQPDIPPVYGDRVQIQQVILNLLMNALEAIEKHHTMTPKVHISTRFKGNDGVILSVSDSGPGIKPDQLTSIFDSFYTTKTGGMGMGLSICRSIAKEYGGEIWAENRVEGGATFFFKLPCEGDRDE